MLRRTYLVERPEVKLVAHPSPRVLEAELLDLVASAHSGDPLAPVLIVVPSRRLADHVTRRLIERFGAILGVTVLHHRALAERVIEHAGGEPKRRLEDELLHTLFARVVDLAAEGPLRDFVRDHPGAGVALRTTMTDLREAGIDAEIATATLSGPEAETAALYALWSAALDELNVPGGAIDDAGLALAAAKDAAAFAAGFSTIIHHGGYDLIGVRVELVRALDRGRELTFLLPADPTDACGRFGVERGSAIAAHDAMRPPAHGEVPKAPVSLFNAQGTRAELRTAAYEALAAVADGTPPHEVAIIVRSFGAYAAAMDSLLVDGGALWHSSHTRPLRSDPAVAAALAAIEAGEDRGPCRFGDHADEFETIAHAAGSGDRLTSLLGSLRDIESLLHDERKISRKEATGWLDARIDAATVPFAGTDGGGVRILDAMQARGLTFAHLGLVGMNAGIFPQVAHEDPFLSDDSLARLREATGRPLPLARERDGEERLVLAMLLASASGRIQVSWRRADDEAKPLVPSLALRDVARFANVDTASRIVPAHPRARLTAWARSPGLLSPHDETLLAALSSETGAPAGSAVTARRPDLHLGVALVAATETFAPTSGAYDGRIGRSGLRPSIAATALEALGRCPLQYFFRHVLRVVAPKTPPTPFETDAASCGSRVHAVLRDVYARLLTERAFADSDVTARILRSREILNEAWSAPPATDEAPRPTRLPVLERIEDKQWLKTLGAFLEADLKRMAVDGLVPDELEFKIEKAIPGGPQDLIVSSRFDRIIKGPSGAVVSDYKTGGSVADRIKAGAMLSGGALQVPIYALLSGQPVELLGVGLDHDPSVDIARFDGFPSDDVRHGVLETLRVVAALAESGSFPIHPGDHCGWCDFRSACRRGHPPTEFREAQAGDTKDARDCWSKTAKLPTLAAVRTGSPP